MSRSKQLRIDEPEVVTRSELIEHLVEEKRYGFEEDLENYHDHLRVQTDDEVTEIAYAQFGVAYHITPEE